MVLPISDQQLENISEQLDIVVVYLTEYFTFVNNIGNRLNRNLQLTAALFYLPLLLRKSRAARYMKAAQFSRILRSDVFRAKDDPLVRTRYEVFATDEEKDSEYFEAYTSGYSRHAIAVNLMTKFPCVPFQEACGVTQRLGRERRLHHR